MRRRSQHYHEEDEELGEEVAIAREGVVSGVAKQIGRC